MTRKSTFLLCAMAKLSCLQFFFLGSVVCVTGVSAVASPLPAPPEVTTVLTKIEQAANRKQLGEVTKNFAPTYTIDGLSLSAWEKSLGQLWQRYPDLRYQTVIQSWKSEKQGMVVDTLTTISGSQNQNGKLTNLKSQIQARQTIVAGKIVQQQILNEQTITTSGEKPPTVELNIPDKLKTNERFNIDAIVQEPLGDDVLMGTMVEQPVTAEGYSKQVDYSLQLLATGGLFKTAKAPGQSGDYWLSATFIRPGGSTTITRRIHVLKR